MLSFFCFFVLLLVDFEQSKIKYYIDLSVKAFILTGVGRRYEFLP